MKNKKIILHILILLFVAFSLRSYHFRLGEVITSSDEIHLYEYSLKPVYAITHGLFLWDLSLFATELFRFFNFAWGWGTILWSSIFVFFLTLFHIPLTEVTMHLPYVFVGVFSVLAAYFLGKELVNERYGFFAAFFIALLPSHIAYSRSIGVNGIVGLFFFFLTLLFFVRYLKTNKKKNLVLTYCFFALYFVSDNQGIGILPLLFFAAFLYSKEKGWKRFFAPLHRCFSFKGIFAFLLILLPTIFGALYLWSAGLLKNSYLNLFHSKPFILSFYGKAVLLSLVDNAGIIFISFLLLAFFYALFRLFFRPSKEMLLVFAWFFMYTAPWLFFVPPTSVDLRVYNTPTLCALIFLSCFLLTDLLSHVYTIRSSLWRTTGVAVFSLILILLIGSSLLVTAKAVYGYDTLSLYAPAPGFGAVNENNGMKALAYYARKSLPSDAALFVDSESFPAQYYFQRKIVGSLDLSLQEIAALLETTEDPFDYAFIQAENKDLLEPLLLKKGFVPIVIAIEENDIQGILYTTSPLEGKSITHLSIKTHDALFDTTYGTLSALYIDFG